MPPTYRSLIVPRHARIGLVGNPDRATEAWLILHGYGMLAQGILHWFRAAEREHRLLVAPEGLSRFYLEHQGTRRVGASWMTREDREHELADLLEYLDMVVAELIPPKVRFEVHGFSQGVAAAARWVVRARRPVDRLVCWGGTIPEDVELPRLSSAVGGTTIHFAVGERDKWVSPDAVAADVNRAVAAGVPVELHRFSGGHRIDDGVLDRLQGA